MSSIPISIEKCIIVCWLTTTLNYLTSSTATRSKLYYTISPATVLNSLHFRVSKHFMFQISHAFSIG
jgi:hypothetical protein